MIEVAVWFAGLNGDGVVNYLIDIPTDDSKGRNYFEAGPICSAIKRALSEFEKDRTRDRITGVKVRTTPDKILRL